MRFHFVVALAALVLAACAAQPQAPETAKTGDAGAGNGSKCYEIPSTGSRVKRPCESPQNGAVRQGSTVRKSGN